MDSTDAPPSAAGRSSGNTTPLLAPRVARGQAPHWLNTRVLLIAAALIVVFVLAAFLLIQPSKKAAFAVSATTGALTVEPQCGERLIWDLPAGRVVGRSDRSLAKELPVRPRDPVTLTVFPGATVHLESTRRGLSLTVGRANHGLCRVDEIPTLYELTDNHEPVPYDAVGIGYSPSPQPENLSQTSEPPTLSLLLSGRVILGGVVRQGGGWSGQHEGILESGTIEGRVVPWFQDDERITEKIDTLDQGSLVDTHPCLETGNERSTSLRRLPALVGGVVADCPNPPMPAIGFLRTLPDGLLSVQLYARREIGTRVFGGEPRVLHIRQSTAAWYSEKLIALASLIVVLFGVYEGTKAIWRDIVRFRRGGRRPLAEHSGAQLVHHAAHQVVERSHEDHPEPRSDKPMGVTGGRTTATLLLIFVATSALAEPVEVRQGSYVGGGYSFRRGSACLVLTARHVVPDAGVAISVVDRGGVKGDGSRVYTNDFYDLALITMADTAQVTCTSTWPDSGWMSGVVDGSLGEFRVVRHEANGRETVIRLTYAGGLRHQLTLAPLDKLTVQEGDSGSLVEVAGRPVGIVQSVNTATDRVNVLRLDQIEQLVGDRFHSRTAEAGSQGLPGCWSYMSFLPLFITITPDGRVTGFLEGGSWVGSGDRQYAITWPRSIDTMTLSLDGRSLTGSNNYSGPGVAGRRSSGDSRSLAGNWQWYNNVATTFRDDGTVIAGIMPGRWSRISENVIRVVWDFAFIDRVTLSGDGRTLSGRNQVGGTVNASRVACAQ